MVVLEKGSEPGAHIISGAVMDPRAMAELFPDWRERGAPLNQRVVADEVLWLGEHKAWRTPEFLVPDCLHNGGNYIVSLGAVTQWLGQQAEALGVEIFPGFAAAEVLFGTDGSVKGVATGNLGVGKDGEPHEGFQLGMELHARYTVFAEGARGHLGKQVIARYRLDGGKDPQSYALGIKELWEIDPAKAKPGLVVHTAGWPMDSDTYGGGFLYHLDRQQGHARLRHRPGLPEPLAEPVRGDAALEDAPLDPRAPRRRQAHRLRRTGDHRRRLAEPAQAGVPGRRAGRLRCRHAQRSAHQGQPRGDEDRHALRRSRFMRPSSSKTAATTNSRPTLKPSAPAGCGTN